MNSEKKLVRRLGVGGWMRRGSISHFWGRPDSPSRSKHAYFKGFWDLRLWTENRGAAKTRNPSTTDPTPRSRPSDFILPVMFVKGGVHLITSSLQDLCIPSRKPSTCNPPRVPRVSPRVSPKTGVSEGVSQGVSLGPFRSVQKVS